MLKNKCYYNRELFICQIHLGNLERGKRIELSASAWKAEVLPLYEPRINKNMLYCKSVSIPYDPIVDTKIVTNIQRQHVKFNTTQLNPEFIEYLKSLNIYVSFVEVFYTKPNTTTDIHIDASPGDITKINYIYGGTDSQMIWYVPNDETCGETKVTCVNSNYVAFTKDEVTQVYADTLTKPSIVQVGAPHNIINRNEARHCLSMVITENYKRITMDRAIEIFGAQGEI